MLKVGDYVRVKPNCVNIGHLSNYIGKITDITELEFNIIVKLFVKNCSHRTVAFTEDELELSTLSLVNLVKMVFK